MARQAGCCLSLLIYCQAHSHTHTKRPPAIKGSSPFLYLLSPSLPSPPRFPSLAAVSLHFLKSTLCPPPRNTNTHTYPNIKAAHALGPLTPALALSFAVFLSLVVFGDHPVCFGWLCAALACRSSASFSLTHTGKVTCVCSSIQLNFLSLVQLPCGRSWLPVNSC